MRKFNLYLFKNKFHIFSFFFKPRILHFKRPKWKKISSRIFYIKKQDKYAHRKLFSNKFSKFQSQLRYLKIIYKKKKFFLKLNFLSFFKNLKIFILSKKYKFLLYKKKKNFKNSLKKIKKNTYLKKTRKYLFNFFFFNFYCLKKKYPLQLRSRFIFKNRLFMAYHTLKYFFGCIPLKFFKKKFFSCLNVKNYKKIMSILLLHFEYRIDILLWRLKIFKTPYLARFACKNNLISYKSPFSNLKTNFNFKKILIGGDIISYNFKYFFKKNLKSYLKSFFLPTLFEIDYYLNNIIVLKNSLNLQYRDINTLLKEPLCIYKFKDYILK